MKNSSSLNSKEVPIKIYAKFEFAGTKNFGEITEERFNGEQCYY